MLEDKILRIAENYTYRALHRPEECRTPEVLGCERTDLCYVVKDNLFFYFFSVAVRLATNYEKISRRGTATVLLSKHINCIAIDKLLIGMEIYFKLKNEKKILQFLD
jgi:hypothetical protein